jgi:hypothetical protein
MVGRLGTANVGTKSPAASQLVPPPLFHRGIDALVAVGQVAAEGKHGHHDRHRNAECEHAILDRTGTLPVPQKINERAPHGEISSSATL